MRFGRVIVLVGCLAGCGEGAERPGPDDDPEAPDTPPDAPRDVRVAGEAPGVCVLRWTAPPGTVDAYEVRASVAGWRYDALTEPLIPGTATEARLDFSAVLPELSATTMRIRAHRGYAISELSATVACDMPLLPVHALTARRTTTGVVLHWTFLDRSIATSIEVDRAELDLAGAPGEWTQITALAPERGAFGTVYTDATLEVGKAYGYRVTTATATRDALSASQHASVVRLDAPLAVTTLSLPRGDFADTDGNGNFAFVDSVISPKMIWRRGDEWITTPRDGGSFRPGIKLDASARPHAIYSRFVANSDVQIVHGWSDGTQWLEETIAQRSLQNGSSVPPATSFDVDASGSPVVLWQLGDSRYEVAIRDGGTWTITRLDDLPVDPLSYKSAVFFDRAGAPHLVFASLRLNMRIEHFERAGNGAWVRERLPLGTRFGTGSNAPLAAVGHDRNHLAVCFEIETSDFDREQAACIRKTPAGWGDIEPLGILTGSGSEVRAGAAMSPDGSRLAVAYVGSDTHVFRSDSNRRWSETVVEHRQLRDIGFDRNGKLLMMSFAFGVSPGSDDNYRLETE